MKIAVLCNYVPFVTCEAHALANSLLEQGHQAMLLRIPLASASDEKLLESMLACRLLQVPNVDLIIGLDFPAYLVPHSNKVLWLKEDLFQSEHMTRAKLSYLPEARKIYAQSQAVSTQLRDLYGIQSEILSPGREDVVRSLTT